MRVSVSWGRLHRSMDIAYPPFRVGPVPQAMETSDFVPIIGDDHVPKVAPANVMYLLHVRSSREQPQAAVLLYV